MFQFAVGYSPLIYRLLHFFVSNETCYACVTTEFLHKAIIDDFPLHHKAHICQFHTKFYTSSSSIFQCHCVDFSVKPRCRFPLPFTFSQPWTIHLSSQYQIRSYSTNIMTFTSLAMSFCLRSLCLSKTVICSLFLGLKSFLVSIFPTSLKNLKFCLCLSLSH